MLKSDNYHNKNIAIKNLYRDIDSCGDCRKLENVSETLVYSRGNPDASCMLIGEGPGEQEERLKMPFVGRAGALLNKTLEDLGFNVERDFYITNIVKHRSYRLGKSGGAKENKPPTAKQIAIERKYLDREIEIVDPKLIVALGAKASQWFLGTDFRLTQSHGTVYDWHGIRILPSYHPSAILIAKSFGDGEERRREFKSDLGKIVGLLHWIKRQ